MLLTQRVSHAGISRRFEISERGVQKGSKDAEVYELAQTITTLSVGMRNAGNGSGVQDKELIKVFSDLQIFPGQLPHQGAIDVTQIWAGLDEDEGIVSALKQDTVDELMEGGEEDICSGSQPF